MPEGSGAIHPNPDDQSHLSLFDTNDDLLEVLALMVLPSLAVGNELLILDGVALAVGAWFIAYRHGQLCGVVDANKSGADGAPQAAKTAGSRQRSL